MTEAFDVQKTLHDTFETVFGNAADVRYYFAPGRVNLIGEHTDYNGGHVFPCALTVGTYGAARLREDKQIRLYSVNRAMNGISFSSVEDLRPLTGEQSWTNYIRGVVWSMQNRNYEFDTGFEMVIYGDIPAGAGLSSSASLEVLTGYALTDLYHFPTSGPELAIIGQDAENNFCGLSCGIMDQFASAMGEEDHALFLDTATLQYESVPLNLKGAKILITNTNVKHSLVDSEYNERRRQCAQALADLQTVTDIRSLGELTCDRFDKLKALIPDETNRRRAKHAVYENARATEAVRALKEGDLAAFGKLMNASHVSLRDDFETSCREADILAEAAWEIPGVYGSRITGGGFGGCTVSIVRDEATEEFRTKLSERYQKETGKTCDFYEVRAGMGPHVLDGPA